MLAWSMHIQRCKIFFYRGVPSAGVHRSSAAYSLIRESPIFCLSFPERFVTIEFAVMR